MGRFNHLEITGAQPGEITAGPGAGAPAGASPPGQTWLERADTAFDMEDFERALGFYSRSLQDDMNVPHAWAGQVRCLIELGELPEAILWSDKALERFPGSAEVLASRGVAEGRYGRHREALGFVDAAIAAQDLTPYVWVARSECLLPMSEVNARGCILKALEMGPRSAEVRTWIGRSLCAHGRWHQALEHWREAARLRPSHAPSWYRAGVCHEELGEMAAANLAYRRALAEKPGYAAALDGVARIANATIFNRLARLLRRLFHRRR